MQKDFEAFIRQGEQAQGRSWRLAKERTSKGVRRMVFFFSSYVWKGAHGKCVCND